MVVAGVWGMVSVGSAGRVRPTWRGWCVFAGGLALVAPVLLPRIGYAATDPPVDVRVAGHFFTLEPSERLMPKTFKNFIDGQWVAPTTGAYFENRNPADTRDLIGRFPDSGAADVEAAVRSAQRGFEIWRRTPAPARGDVLRRLGDLLTTHKEELADAMTREMGKVLAETRGDVQEGIDTAYYAATEGRRLFGHTVPSELRDKWAMSYRRPIGVAGLITPFNFPLAIPTWKMFPALVCGNAVMLKPSEDVPHTSHRLVELLLEAGSPARGDPAGPRPGRHGGQGAGGASGGPGHLVHRLHGHRLVHRRDLRADAQAAVAGNGRQERADRDGRRRSRPGARRRAVGRVRHHRPAVHRHEPAHPAPEDSRPLPPASWSTRPNRCAWATGGRATTSGPLIHERSRQKVESYVEIGLEEGAVLLTGGKKPGGERLGHGWFYRPTIFAGVKPSMRLAQEEIFGPVLSVIEVRSLDEAIRVNNGVKYGLSSSIYTRDVNPAFRALQELDNGITYVNAPTIGAEAHLPFGGVKQTGNGHREGGWEVYEFYSETKVGYVDYCGTLQRAQIDNYDD